MAVPASIPKFFDPERPPSPGGWRYWLDPDSRQYPIQAYSAAGVFDEIKRYEQNNGKYVSDDSIWRRLWAYWCSLEPARCGKETAPAVTPAAMPGKEVWGPILWRMLNWAAVNYSPSFFSVLVTEMRLRLIVCPECAEHFDEILARNPVRVFANSKQACQWVNAVHNSVNLKIGKPIYPYGQGIAEYGFPPL